MIDTHVHTVIGNPAYPKSLSVELLIAEMDRAGIAKAVVVQSRSGNGLHGEYPSEAARRYPDRLISICGGDPEAVDAAATLRFRVNRWGARGVRLFWGAWQPGSPQYDDIWDTAIELGVPILLAGQARFDEIPPLLDRFPALQLVLDHCGDPDMSYGTPAGLLRLADHQNVVVKFSTHFLDQADRQNVSAQEIFVELVAAFGADRLMWGSNYPASHEPRWPYQKTIAACRTLISRYNAAEQQWMSAGTAIMLWPELAR